MSDTSNHKRPAAEPLERFVDADTQPIKKRKLDLVKCDRCRDDKVKCLPVSRTFPEKCDRCEAKDLPCSEGKRAKRKSKHTPDVVPSSSSNLTEGADTKEFEDQFQRWLFVSYYQSNVAAAADLSRSLQTDMLKPFLDCDAVAALMMRSSPDHATVGRIANIEAMLTKLLHDLTRDLFETGLLTTNLTVPAWSLTMLIKFNLLAISTEADCPICFPSPYREDFFEDILGVYEVLVRKKRLIRRCKLSATFSHMSDGHLLQKDVSQYLEASEKMMLRAQNIFIGLGMDDVATTVKDIGFELCIFREDVPDCLGRNLLHNWLDRTSDQNDGYHFIKDRIYANKDARSFINAPDIFGRSLLHIACQKGLKAVVRLLLVFYAEPGQTTMYGSLPLHYAAAQGHVVICRLLLGLYHNRDDRFEYDIHQMDFEGKSAMDYAVKHGHTEISRLLAEHPKSKKALTYQSNDGDTTTESEDEAASSSNEHATASRNTVDSTDIPRIDHPWVSITGMDATNQAQNDSHNQYQYVPERGFQYDDSSYLGTSTSNHPPVPRPELKAQTGYIIQPGVWSPSSSLVPVNLPSLQY